MNGKVASSGGGELSTSSSAILLTTLRAVTTVDGGAGTSSLQAVPEGSAVRTVPSSIVLDPCTPVLILTESEVPCPQLTSRSQPQLSGGAAVTGPAVTRNARDITSSSVMTGWLKGSAEGTCVEMLRHARDVIL
uniref:Uncharacterized protein n=1 Tax=Anopheles culicifacies TaxID=139723 RepID=A0A182MHJ9_9DIPT